MEYNTAFCRKDIGERTMVEFAAEMRLMDELHSAERRDRCVGCENEPKISFFRRFLEGLSGEERARPLRLRAKAKDD